MYHLIDVYSYMFSRAITIKMFSENRKRLARSHAVNKDDIKFYEIIQNLMTALPLPSTD